MGSIEEKVPDAMTEWSVLYEILAENGAEILLIPPVKGLPDMCFLDCGLVLNGTFIPSNFKHPQRQPEREHYIEYFSSLGYKIKEISGNFEGHGDTLWNNSKLFVGHGFRTDITALTEIQEMYDQVIPIELVDPRFYHLDTCFCPLSKGVAMIYSPAVSRESLELIKKNIKVLIEVTLEEALCFCCNAVFINNVIVMPTSPYTLYKTLKNMGYMVIMLPMNAFIKAGGACKCLSFTF
uniref:Amidinotransferase n=1 Tax=viral metagenome TaxID=1070528 RepID=A0A6C0IAT5_9ZZZZ